ncbi:DUF2164 domain-containing protein [Paenibacillus aceti]|uniref:DUF2164 domain-containing protein n=1 Tax=Paenibacillus aceti TaxID=1820010 RepID=A0ABQ1VS46_9BACL|nr:DUF2164 domain-containing protein [Paenibacillus aceti]GGF94514.1 hypothetical protein GCM10010913_15040 [Paenibacillus aceti]
MIPIKLPREQKQEIVERVKEYFELERSESIGDIAAEQLLDFMLKELAPYVYNKAVEDARQAVEQKWASIEEELYSLKKPLR